MHRQTHTHTHTIQATAVECVWETQQERLNRQCVPAELKNRNPLWTYIVTLSKCYNNITRALLSNHVTQLHSLISYLYMPDPCNTISACKTHTQTHTLLSLHLVYTCIKVRVRKLVVRIQFVFVYVLNTQTAHVPLHKHKWMSNAHVPANADKPLEFQSSL